MLVYQSWDINLFNSKFISGHSFGCNVDYCLALGTLPFFLIRFPTAVFGGKEAVQQGFKACMQHLEKRSYHSINTAAKFDKSY